MSKHQVQLADYSKHTPRLLRHQIICALMKKYVPQNHDEVLSPPNASEESYGPSIQRFHGALLFVDISGFTALSLKLDVEALKNHINSYFSKMLDIVEKWDGDVVKFAGDALFIIWPTLVDHSVNATGGQHVEGHTSHSSATPSMSSHFALSAKRALEKAVACGLEISSVCGNYEVKLTEHSNESSSILSRLLPSFLLGGGQKVAPSSSSIGEASAKSGKGEDTVYLNVHSGVSSGLMASIDLLSPNRGEFFLIGEPLTGVAMAESQASKGDVVLCTASHELLHGDNANQALSRHLGLSSKEKAGGEGGGDDDGELVELQVQPGSTKVHGVTIQCGCHRTPNGLYRVSKLLTRRSSVTKATAADKRKTKGKLKEEQTKIRNEWSAINEKCYGEISSDIEKLLISSQLSIKQEIYAFLRSRHSETPSDSNPTFLEGVSSEGAILESEEQGDKESQPLIVDRKDEDRHLASVMWANVKVHFTEWMDHSLLTYSTMHVHEVERLYHVYKSPSSGSSSLSFHDVLNKSMRGIPDADRGITVSSGAATQSERNTSVSISLHEQESASTSEHVVRFEVPSSSRDSVSSHGDGDMDKQVLLSPKSKRAAQEKSNKGFSTELNNGEIRSVIVLFIKIERFDLRLRIDAVGKPRTFAYNRFSFLDRTESEIEADEQLMRRFQACYSILCKALSDHGGQLRQFIVDDKGTVCIGTFGLRGSASVDNAAAAVAAAKQIVDGLKASGLSASIGITSGKGYCGCVGSAVRHEYAVMGPSTNLAARLMCKAPQHGVICDADTVDRDRKHHFEPLGEIQAKGYSRPVMTYAPVFDFQEDEQLGMGYFRFPSSKRLLMTSKRYGNAVKSAIASIASVKTTFSAPIVPKKLTMKEKILELCNSDFYITDSRNHFYSDEGTVRRLYGRQSAIQLILPFLLDTDTVHHDGLICSGHTKLVVVCGASGIGKTAVLDAIEHKLQIFIRSDTKFNAVVIRNRVHNLRQDTPFGIWQLLLVKLLSFMKRYTMSSSGNGSVTGETRRSMSISASFSSVSLSNYQDVLDYLWPSLPAEYHDKRQVLNMIALPNDRDAGGIAENEEEDIESALEIGVDLLAALLQAIVNQVKKLVIIIIESTEGLDRWSLQLLHRVYCKVTGVVFLVDFCTTDAMSLDRWKQEMSSKNPRRSIQLMEPSVIDSTARFFKKYNDPNVFKIVAIEPLQKGDALAMAREVLMDRENDVDVDSIFEASAGTPLYIMELMKSLHQNTNAISSERAEELGIDVIRSAPATASYRVEEIICYRLDKLNVALQVILKAGAVAASYGKIFDVNLLHYMLSEHSFFTAHLGTVSASTADDSDQHSHQRPGHVTASSSVDTAFAMKRALSIGKVGTTSIPESILELLRVGDFLRVVSSGSEAESADKCRIKLENLSTATLGFRIPLEQSIIYSLIVDEQKEYFHERVALYLHSKQRKLDLAEVGCAELWEQGFHWDKAAMWSRALRSYFQAAKKNEEEDNDLRCAESLLLGYQMFQNLEQELSAIGMPESCYQLADHIAFFLFNPTPESFEPLASNIDMLMAIKVAKQVFEHDPGALIDAIDLHVMLAKIHLYKWEDAGDTMMKLLTAVVLCLAATWKEDSKVGKPGLLGIQEYRKRSNRSVLSEGDEYLVFYRSLDRMDIIKLFCLCSYTARFAALEKPFVVSFEHSKTLLLQDAESSFDINNPHDSTAVLVIQLEVMIALRYIQLGKPRRACTFIDRIIELYSVDRHSTILVDRYGMDLCPYAVALLAQALIMGRDMHIGISYWHKACNYLDTVDHGYSSTIALIVLLSCVRFTGEFACLKTLLAKAMHQEHKGFNSLGTMFKHLLEIWMDSCCIPQEGGMAIGAALIKTLLETCDAFDNQLAHVPRQTACLFNQSSATNYIELTMGKTTFLELHGCALERIYVSCIGRLWPYADKSNIYQLEQRLQSSLQILIQSPAYDYVSITAKGINIFYCLLGVILTAKSSNGVSAAAVYLAVTERAEQPLLQIIQLMKNRDMVSLACFLAHITLRLPLHDGIIESYKLEMSECSEKVADVYGHAETDFMNVMELIGLGDVKFF